MKLNTLLRTVGATAVLLTAGAAHAHDSKPEVIESYEFSGFDRITIEGVYHLDVQVGQPFSIKASGSKKDMAKAKIFVEDGAQD